MLSWLYGVFSRFNKNDIHYFLVMNNIYDYIFGVIRLLKAPYIQRSFLLILYNHSEFQETDIHKTREIYLLS